MLRSRVWFPGIAWSDETYSIPLMQFCLKLLAMQKLHTWVNTKPVAVVGKTQHLMPLMNLSSLQHKVKAGNNHCSVSVWFCMYRDVHISHWSTQGSHGAQRDKRTLLRHKPSWCRYIQSPRRPAQRPDDRVSPDHWPCTDSLWREQPLPSASDSLFHLKNLL